MKRTHLRVYRNFNSMSLSANYSLNKREKKRKMKINFREDECMHDEDGLVGVHEGGLEKLLFSPIQ